MSGWDLAIDVGATSVAAAVREHGRVEIIRFDGAQSFPALVFFAAEQPPLTGPAAHELALATPDRAVWSPRRALADGDTVLVAGEAMPLARAYAAILSVVLTQAAAGRKAAAPARLVLSCPPVWSDRELAVMREAARLAGLPEPVIVTRPVAAASHLAAGAGTGELLAILDVSNGTIDAAVLRRTQDGFEFAGPPGGLDAVAGGEPEALLRRGVYELLATITNAGLTPQQLSAIHITGPSGAASHAATLADAILGVHAQLAGEPETVTVRGALSPGRARQQAGYQPESAQGRGPRRVSGRLLAAVGAAAAVCVAIAVTIALTVGGVGGAGGGIGGHGQAGGAAPAGHGALASFRISQHKIAQSHGAPDTYKVSLEYPVVTGMSNAAAQRRVNAALRQPAELSVHGLAKYMGRCPAPGVPVGNCGFIGMLDTVYRTGALVSVKYYTETHFSGAGDINYSLQAVTVRMDTGAILAPSAIVTSAALSAAGRNSLAASLQAQHGISSCDTLPGWPGESGIPPALATLATSSNPGVIVNVTHAGLEFSFGDNALSPTACRPVGVLPLTGLASPAVIALSAGRTPS